MLAGPWLAPSFQQLVAFRTAIRQRSKRPTPPRCSSYSSSSCYEFSSSSSSPLSSISFPLAVDVPDAFTRPEDDDDITDRFSSSPSARKAANTGRRHTSLPHSPDQHSPTTYPSFGRLFFLASQEIIDPSGLYRSRVSRSDGDFPLFISFYFGDGRW